MMPEMPEGAKLCSPLKVQNDDSHPAPVDQQCHGR